jgi:hypothetical protein
MFCAKSIIIPSIKLKNYFLRTGNPFHRILFSINLNVVGRRDTLQLQKEKQQITLPYKPDQLKIRIEYTDEKINKLVFELYGLGEEERRIVEGKNKIL